MTNLLAQAINCDDPDQASMPSASRMIAPSESGSRPKRRCGQLLLPDTVAWLIVSRRAARYLAS